MHIAHLSVYRRVPFVPHIVCSSVIVWHVLDNIQLRSLSQILHTDANAT